MDTSIWAERYRPHRLEDYVWRDETLKAKANQWIRDRAVPHVLFSGDAGVGKTSLAYLILEVIGIPKSDILYIPASRERKIDEIIERISMFSTTCAWNDTGIKYVILDEADSISKQAQKALRADMEIYQHSCRFIMTCNYLKDIIEPLQSRVENYHFSALNQDEFTQRLIQIMTAERIDVTDIDNIQAMVEISDKFYPDLRKSIGMLQQGCIEDQSGSRRLIAPKASDSEMTKPYLLTACDQIMVGNWRAARTSIVQSAPLEEYPDIYRWLYRNLHLWGTTEDQQDEALLAIRTGVVNHKDVADPEINLAATLAMLKMIALKSK